MDVHEGAPELPGPKKQRLLLAPSSFVRGSQVPSASGAYAAPPGLTGTAGGALLAIPSSDAHMEYRGLVDKTFGSKLSAEDNTYIKKCTAELGAKIGALQKVNKRADATKDAIKQLSAKKKWPAGVRPYAPTYTSPFLETPLEKDWVVSYTIPAGTTHGEAKEEFYRQMMIHSKEVDLSVSAKQRGSLKEFCSFEAFQTRCLAKQPARTTAWKALDLDYETPSEDIAANLIKSKAEELYQKTAQTAMLVRAKE
jgi:hypothetical protein